MASRAWWCAALGVMASCSLVLEDRSACPCEMEISVSGVKGETSVVVGGELVCRVWSDSTLSCRVQRGKVAVMAVSGVSAGEFTDFLGAGQAFRIPEGLDSPPLRLGYTIADASGDSASVDVVMRKEHCTLSLEVDGPPGWGEPYLIKVRSDVCGYSLDGGLLEGPFSYMMTLSEEGRCSVFLPRQGPSSPLVLDILMPDRILRTFSLSAYMQKAGYDWSAPDLPDLSLRLSLSVTAFTIHIGPWSETFPMDVVI